jgi:hypothetical protein
MTTYPTKKKPLVLHAPCITKVLIQAKALHMYRERLTEPLEKCTKLINHGHSTMHKDMEATCNIPKMGTGNPRAVHAVLERRLGCTLLASSGVKWGKYTVVLYRSQHQKMKAMPIHDMDLFIRKAEILP